MQESDKKSCCGGGSSTSDSKLKPCGRCRRAGVTTTTTAEPSIATDGRCDECGRRLSSDADTVTTTADTAAERTRFSSGQPVLERKTGVTAVAAARYDIGRTVTDLPAPCADLPCRDTRRVDQPSGTPAPAEYSHPFRRIAYVTDNNACPLDREELGFRTWSMMHTLVAFFPENPTPQQRKDMEDFFFIVGRLYPCIECSSGFKELLTIRPPETESRATLSKWLCWVHNQVNAKLGKPQFDCHLVNERWKDGWQDGSCR